MGLHDSRTADQRDSFVLYGSHSGEERWLQTSSRQKGWHWHFTQSGKQVLCSQVSRERAPYQLLFSVSPVISEAHCSVLVLLREGAMEQQSLRTKTHTHTQAVSIINYTWYISVFEFVNTAVLYLYTWLHSNRFSMSAKQGSELNLIKSQSNWKASCSHLLKHLPIYCTCTQFPICVSTVCLRSANHYGSLWNREKSKMS